MQRMTEKLDGTLESSNVSDVLRGFDHRPKILPSWYLYDDRGAELFKRITELKEYYIPRTEMEILCRALPEISSLLGKRAMIFEPGSGASPKTRLLLGQLDEPAAYVPIDISCEQLFDNAASLRQKFPQIDISPVCADFMHEFEFPRLERRFERTLAFFPGSTIGNVVPEEAISLLKRMGEHCGREGAILIGVDLQKDTKILEAAYDDPYGVSADFAMNYLLRLNREMDANFDLDRFSYSAIYNEHLGRIEMYLVSLANQIVEIGNRLIDFYSGERMRTEVSYKYTLNSFKALAAKAGLAVERTWIDARHYFSVQLLSAAKTRQYHSCKEN